MSRRTSRLWLPAALAVAATLPQALLAQYTAPPPPAAYALSGVTVVQGDGSRTEDVTIVIRRGIVETLAAGADVPGDARVLEGEGLVIYPGMVDAQGALDLTFADANDVGEESDLRVWNSPRSRQGFTPHRRVVDGITMESLDLEDEVEAGIVASLVHAGGGMAPGRPAVTIHRHAETPWGIVQDPTAGLTLTFQSGRGTYPSQLFGVIAYLRQAFLDAERYTSARGLRGRDTRGALPQAWDGDMEVVQMAARGETPVYFVANSDEDIRRVLNLQDEFGFNLILVGGEEAWKLADELASRRVPVLVSLDLPEGDAWDHDTPADELSPEAAREAEELEAAWANPARLMEAGVTVAFTSGGGDADMLEGLRALVLHGMDEGAALRAVTETPANMVGLSRLARIAEGGPATFMVSTGELFDEDSRLRYVFVEGHLTDLGAPTAAAAGSGEAPAGDLTGGWSGTITVGGDEAEISAQVEQAEDGTLSGSIQGEQLPESDISGSVAGNQVTIVIEAEGLPDPIVINGTLSEDGSTIEGSASTPFGELDVELTRDGNASWSDFLGGTLR